jgi:hypothetical protein
MADPAHPGHAELRELYDDYDPEAFDLERVSERLAKLRAAEPAARAKPRRAAARK